jgi:hypothetical protein
MHFGRFLFDMTFFFVVVVILANIVFGIILDAFAEMRIKKYENEQLIKDKCFICDIERSRFDIKANGFFFFFFLIK